MTGIERLREFAEGISPFTVVCGVTTTSYDREHTEVEGARLRDFLSDIAGQIERETKPKSDAVKYASVSAYDPPSQEEREAAAWVRERGGLEAVRRRWECLSYYADPVPRSCMEKRLARLQRQIDESHAALRRRREVISELNRRACDLTRENAELRKRAMPDGMEWPTVDGKPVDFVTGYEPSLGVLEAVSIYSNGACEVMGHDGIIKGVKEIHVATPKVLDADGVEIREGDTVWSTQLDEPHEWIVIDPHGDRDDSQTVLVSIGDRTGHARPENLTHRAPVLAADGKPLEVGQTVYAKNYDYVKCTVLAIEWVVDGYLVEVENEGGHKFRQTPDQLTHERPVEDTWERIEEDARSCTCVMEAIDLVRRARALSERDA